MLAALLKACNHRAIALCRNRSMDDAFWVLLVLAGVIFLFLGPIGFFLTIGARRRLDIAESKILALEAQPHVAHGLLATAPAPEVVEAPSPPSLSSPKRSGPRARGKSLGQGFASATPKTRCRARSKPGRSSRRHLSPSGHGAVSKRRSARTGQSMSVASRWPLVAFCSCAIRSSKAGLDPVRAWCLASCSP